MEDMSTNTNLKSDVPDVPIAPAAPVVSPASSTPPTVVPSKKVKTEDCGKACLKGGSPHRASVTSSLLLIFIALSTLLGVLLINEKRTSYTKVTSAPATSIVKMESEVEVETPPAIAPKPTFVSEVKLPEPSLDGDMSVEGALATRRSRRAFEATSLTQAQLGQMLWSAQGVTDDDGHRTAPSARNLYPFTIYAAVNEVEDLEAGLYAYIPDTHAIGLIAANDMRMLLEQGGVQATALPAPVVLLMSASFGTMVEKFPDNYHNVTYLEGGHIGQNLYLMAESMSLGMVTQAGFDPDLLGKTIGLDPLETILYVIPVGIPASEEVVEE